MMSLFLNELYGFQLDNHRWYPLELRKEKSTKDKLKRSQDEKPNGTAPGSKMNEIESEKFMEHDGGDDLDGDEASESTITEISLRMKRNASINTEMTSQSNEKTVESSSGVVQNSEVPEIVKPCGRINSCMVVGRDTLYIYGGMMEMRDREITLDDLYTLNLSKLDEWKCIVPASQSEWIEESENEDEDEDEDEDDMEDDNGDNSDETGDEDDAEAINGSTPVQMGDAVAIIKGESKNMRRKEKRARIEQIRASLGLSDSQRTPVPGESLKDFYKRTNMYWQMAAYEHTQHTGKELRKDGFDLAESRYKELKPILDELAILEAEQKAEEEEAPETSLKKRGNKNKHLGSK